MFYKKALEDSDNVSFKIQARDFFLVLNIINTIFPFGSMDRFTCSMFKNIWFP